MSASRVLSWLLPAALLLAGCEDPLTQLVVVVDGDWDGFERIEIDVRGFDQPAATSASLGDGGLPRRVAIVHDGGPLGPLDVEVRAFVAESSNPVLVEPRGGIYFEQDETILLRVDLRFACIGQCGEAQACMADLSCVGADGATELSNWSGAPQEVPVAFRVEDGDAVTFQMDTDGNTVAVAVPGPDTGAAGVPGGDGDGDGMSDGGTDEPPVGPTTGFDYTVSNLDPTDPALLGVQRSAVSIDCDSAEFNSTTRRFDGWCGPQPVVTPVEQGDGSDLVVLAMDSLQIAADGRLRLTGELPVALVVYGDVTIEGELDASARRSDGGPGSGTGCVDAGPGGTASGGLPGGGGGGGGGFGAVGGSGGSSESSGSGLEGAASGTPELVPLRGGCPGGQGGAGAPGADAGGDGGGGGGAVQLSASGRVEIIGRVVAVGGGGRVGAETQDGGGGGGSGGGILIEGAPVALDTGAVVSANGGGGGAGQPSVTADSDGGSDGERDSDSRASGGNSDYQGDGGRGGARGAAAEAGDDGEVVVALVTPFTGAGGGGGAVGRIRINGLTSCSPRGLVTPAAAITCDGCGVCPPPPEAE